MFYLKRYSILILNLINSVFIVIFVKENSNTVSKNLSVLF